MTELTGPVHVVGVGMLGTSVALACRAHGLTVYLSDLVPGHVRTARGLGAGLKHHGEPVQLVVVAVPPDHLGEAIADALADPDVVVTDVGSIKGAPLRALAELPEDAVRRYVGSHPMAGSERSGPLAGSASLFEGRPWAVTPHEHSDPAAVAVVTALVELCGGVVTTMSPEDHDRAVARTSHLPHLMSSLVAGRLPDAPPEHLALSGQGLRDVTRIAAGDPALWEQIVSANAPAILDLLEQVREQLGTLIDTVAGSQPGALAALLDRGVTGTQAIPGKHGGPARPMASVFVTLPDAPGGLARLFADAGVIGVNIEDVRIDHDPGRPVGVVELVVAAEHAEHLLESLEAREWEVHR